MLTDLLPLRNGVTLPNRVWLAPMTNQQSHADGTLSDDELHWLLMRARGGFGVIETCAAHVSRDGQGWPGELGVFDDALLPGLTRLASGIREAGSRGIVQIFHGGTRAPAALTGQEPWSASEEAGVARAATEEDITRVIAHFGEAARRAERAGFDGVELHGAHGYLLCQFLSLTMNRRTDGWGGALAGRARLVREAMRAARRAVRPGFVVGVRLSPEDRGNARGLDLDESLQVAAWLAEDGADFIHISLWDASKNTAKRPSEHPVPLFRRALPKDVALVAAGSVWTRSEGEALLDKGADAVALGKAAIANPSWPRAVVDAGWEPSRPPFTLGELRERGASPGFAANMKRFPGFVRE